MKREQVNDTGAFLEHKAYNLRKWSMVQTSQAGSGHPTSCLSAADIVAVLFFYAMRYDPRNMNNPNNDRFILSKGHAAPVLYAAWKEVGVLKEQHLFSYRNIHSVLEGHPTYRFSYAEAATGSLGMGLSIGVGMALCAKRDNRSYVTYVLMGDSETAEGSVWEAAELAAYYKLDNLVGIIDCNRLGQSTQTIFGCAAKRYEDIFTGFGFKAFIVEGHDISALMAVFDKAREELGSGKPVIIIAKTCKGYGVDYVEDKEGFHGQAFKKENVDALLAQLKARFLDAALYVESPWQPQMPNNEGGDEVSVAQRETFRSEVTSELSSHVESRIGPKSDSSGELPGREGQGASSMSHGIHHAGIDNVSAIITIPACTYEKTAMIATRKAYGQALALLGDVSPLVVSLDAEVKNSTYAELFEKKHPDRFFQCFIAEQNMVGMGIGFARRGKIPFISTFGCFFTRAHDQIRMAVLSNVALRLVGSHVGVSIGQDGPSQMALEDIGMMRALPESIVLYPCDAVSTHKLVEQMARYDKGISYMRTTRGETPVLYDNNEQFSIGGCKVVRQNHHDKVCIIAAGITVWSALKAYDSLVIRDCPIHVSVIDLYSIKPLDLVTVISVARASGNKVLTVEDHYIQGGIGEVVAAALCNTNITVSSLAVTELPRSGTSEELLAWAQIDTKAIIARVLELLHV